MVLSNIAWIFEPLILILKLIPIIKTMQSLLPCSAAGSNVIWASKENNLLNDYVTEVLEKKPLCVTGFTGLSSQERGLDSASSIQ